MARRDIVNIDIQGFESLKYVVLACHPSQSTPERLYYQPSLKTESAQLHLVYNTMRFVV
jgi:hypothetical protein